MKVAELETEFEMRLPPNYIPDLDHRITVLLSFTLRCQSGFFEREPQTYGDLYRASLEGAAIMLRMLIEFLGLKADQRNIGKLKPSSETDTRLGIDALSEISAIDKDSLDTATTEFLARMHSEASKRTAHPNFGKITTGLDPEDLQKASKFILTEIWQKCYYPAPIPVHNDLYRLLPQGHWEGIPFCPSLM